MAYSRKRLSTLPDTHAMRLGRAFRASRDTPREVLDKRHSVGGEEGRGGGGDT